MTKSNAGGVRVEREVRLGRGARKALARMSACDVRRGTGCVHVGEYTAFDCDGIATFYRRQIVNHGYFRRILFGYDLILAPIRSKFIGCARDPCVRSDSLRYFMIESLKIIHEHEMADLVSKRVYKFFGPDDRAIDINGSTIYFSGSYPESLVQQAERITQKRASDPYAPA